jgi:hypothetical protein
MVAAKRAMAMVLAAAASISCGVQPAMSATASAPVRITFAAPAAGIAVSSPLTLPTVTVRPTTPTVGSSAAAVSGTGVNSGAVQTSSTQSGVVTGNTQLTIRGQPGDVVSTTTPESFTVVRSGGQESLTVKTNTNAEVPLGNGDAGFGGAIMNGNTMSVDIGGALNLASAQNLVPGQYEGLLVVVVQYN